MFPSESLMIPSKSLIFPAELQFFRSPYIHFPFRTNNFAAFGKQRGENASKPLVQTSVDSSVDGF